MNLKWVCEFSLWWNENFMLLSLNCICLRWTRIDKEDELQCLIKGCNFLLKNIPDEAFVYQRHCYPQYKFQITDTEAVFPYLLVNIGSGVSLIKVGSFHMKSAWIVYSIWAYVSCLSWICEAHCKKMHQSSGHFIFINTKMLNCSACKQVEWQLFLEIKVVTMVAGTWKAF